MIPLALVFLFQNRADAVVPWQVSLSQGPTAKILLKERWPHPTQKPGGSNKQARTNVDLHKFTANTPSMAAQSNYGEIGGTPIYVYKAGPEKRRETDGQVLTLEGRGEWKAARGVLRENFYRFPDQEFGCEIADADLKLGNFREALAAVLPFIRDSRVEDTTLLRAALAASELGQTYPGEWEFCRKEAIQKGTDMASYLPETPSPSAIILLSCLGLVPKVSTWRTMLLFASEAETLSPGNPVVALALDRCYSQWSAPFPLTLRMQVLKAALPNCHEGWVKNVVSGTMYSYADAIKRNLPENKYAPPADGG